MNWEREECCTCSTDSEELEHDFLLTENPTCPAGFDHSSKWPALRNANSWGTTVETCSRTPRWGPRKCYTLGSDGHYRENPTVTRNFLEAPLAISAASHSPRRKSTNLWIRKEWFLTNFIRNFFFQRRPLEDRSSAGTTPCRLIHFEIQITLQKDPKHVNSQNVQSKNQGITLDYYSWKCLKMNEMCNLKKIISTILALVSL